MAGLQALTGGGAPMAPAAGSKITGAAITKQPPKATEPTYPLGSPAQDTGEVNWVNQTFEDENKTESGKPPRKGGK